MGGASEHQRGHNHDHSHSHSHGHGHDHDHGDVTVAVPMVLTATAMAGVRMARAHTRWGCTLRRSSLCCWRRSLGQPYLWWASMRLPCGCRRSPLLWASAWRRACVLVVATIHMINHAAIGFKEDCVPARFRESYDAYAFLLAVIAALIMHVVDVTVTAFVVGDEDAGAGAGEDGDKRVCEPHGDDVKAAACDVDDQGVVVGAGHRSSSHHHHCAVGRSRARPSGSSPRCSWSSL
ncbi:hypothetical protein ERJ75_000440700 [Trypanosoma vivax]|nr:hypothetical protein ERJ75_000440700 [Trypanosoma vivax]